MLVFIAIALASALLLCGSLFIGHDHDHDFADHDLGDHEAGGGHEIGVSVFSLKVVTTLTLGFGAFGAVAMYFTDNPFQSSLWGVAAGAVLAFLMFEVMRAIYAQQASSDLTMDSAVGRFGSVVTSIDGPKPGQVGISADGRYQTYPAKSKDDAFLPVTTQIKVVGKAGTLLVVEAAKESQ
jgi:membrane-bound ClpP family serine protease